MMKFAGLCLGILLSFYGLAAAQAPLLLPERGLPFYNEHFAPQTYGAQPQNWAVVQDRKGFIYVANNNGVLQFDGVTWRLIQTTTRFAVLSLDVDSSGTVFVGVKGDFGYLRPDAQGSLEYMSLIEEVDPDERNINEVWGTHVTSRGVFFQSTDRIFLWDGDQMQSWSSGDRYHTSFHALGRFFVRVLGKGLMEVADDSLRLVPGGDRFRSTPVYMMASYDEGRVLIATRKLGLLLFDGTTFTPMETEVDDLVGDSRLYHGCALPGGSFALATQEAGVLIIDRTGRLVQVLDEANGFVDNVVNYVYPDAQGGLWMALNNRGIARADVPSALSFFDNRLGLDGVPYDLRRHRDTLYAATSKGLYYLDRKPAAADTAQAYARFAPVFKDLPTWTLLGIPDGSLLAATSKGVYQIGSGDSLQALSDQPTFVLHPSRQFPETVFVGRGNGLGLLSRTSTGWIFVSLHDVVNEEIRAIVETDEGFVWLATAYGHVLRLHFSNGLDSPPEIETYETRHGLPGGGLSIIRSGKRLFFASRDRILRYVENPADDALHFVTDTSLFAVHPEQRILRALYPDGDNLWIGFNDQVVRADLQADGSYRTTTPDLLRFPQVPILPLFADTDGVLWIGNEDGVVRYDPAGPAREHRPFSVHIRTISDLFHPTVFYGGGPITTPLPPFHFSKNDLRFEFSAATFNGLDQIRFRFMLEGVDDEWSNWSPQPYQTYANLREGHYRFRVRARDVRGEEGREAAFAFSIAPPWYRTWWAYLLYFSLVGAAVFLSYQYRSILQENRRAQQQALELARERLLNERLQHANESLERTNKMKDEFLANVSHELRTPLTAILGFTNILKQEARADTIEFFEIIEKSGERLLSTINALLEFARLRAEMTEITPELTDVGQLARGACRLLKPLADKKRLALTVSLPEQTLHSELDPHFLDQILHNLIGNAIKFTDSGSVSVEVGREADRVFIQVVDTGIGIEESFMPNLFEAFKQESTGWSRTHEGSGLGLAITARQVSIMKGDIQVTSRKGVGSTFKVSFPRAIVPQEVVADNLV